MSTIIKLEELSYIYPCGRQGLSGVNCEIGEGDSVGLLGANGAGKSTLLSILAGLYMPTNGQVTVDGFLLNKANLKTIRRKVGLTFQNPDNQLFMPTVMDDVAFALLNRGCNKIQAANEAREALAMVGAEGLELRAPYQLSGGEKRLVAIAAVLAMQPFILAFDEPTADLDHFARRQLINVLSKRRETKIIATHDLDMVMDLCDKVIILNAGSFLAAGKPSEILGDAELLARARLETPLRRRVCTVCGQ